MILTFRKLSFLLFAVYVATIPAHAQDGSPDNKREFFEAILLQDDDALAEALSNGADPNERGPDGSTPLALAIEIGSADVVRYLLIAGADKELVTDGFTPLELAQLIGREEIVALLAPQSGSSESSGLAIDPDAALRTALEASDNEAIKRALEEGANPNPQDGYAPLIAATALGDREHVELLLEAGADPSKGVTNQPPPLFLAISFADEGLVEILLEAGADPNAKFEGTPLLSAAVLTSEGIAELLFNAGARADAQDEAGTTPIELAAVTGKERLLELFGHEALSNAPPPVLLEAILNDQPDRITEALKTQNINQFTDDGTPYLHLLAFSTRSRTAFANVAFGKDTNLLAKDQDGRDLIDVLISRPVGGVSDDLLSLLLETRDPQITEEVVSLFSQRDANGLSGWNRILIGWPNKDVPVTSLLNDRHVELAFIADGSGSAPVETAILFDRMNALEGFMKDQPDISKFEPSLQDLARANENWDAFRYLPYDRMPPVKAMSDEIISIGEVDRSNKEVQAWLKQLGYYTGEVDGKLGAGTRTALKILSLDVAEEVVRIANVGRKRLSSDDVVPSPGRLKSIPAGNMSAYSLKQIANTNSFSLIVPVGRQCYVAAWFKDVENAAPESDDLSSLNFVCYDHPFVVRLRFHKEIELQSDYYKTKEQVQIRKREIDTAARWEVKTVDR